MKSTFLNQFRNEDWMSTLMGLLLVAAVIALPGWIPKFPKTLSTAEAWLSVGGLFLIGLVFSGLGIKLIGERLRGFLPAFAGIFVLSVLCQYVASIPAIKTIGLESVFFSVALGLLIRNTVGLPKWLAPAVRSEYYIKMGLVLLGTSVVFGEIMKAGALGLLQALVVVLAVWYFTFWLAKKLRVDPEMGIMLASAVSICGVSAAIATCGAIKGDSKNFIRRFNRLDRRHPDDVRDARIGQMDGLIPGSGRGLARGNDRYDRSGGRLGEIPGRDRRNL